MDYTNHSTTYLSFNLPFDSRGLAGTTVGPLTLLKVASAMRGRGRPAQHHKRFLYDGFINSQFLHKSGFNEL